MDLTLIQTALPQLAGGAVLTLELVLLSLAAGIVLAVATAFGQLSRLRPLSLLVGAYVFVFRSTPLLVQIFLVYYGLGQFDAVRGSLLWPLLREPYWCAILALTLNTGAYGGEIIRGGILSVPFGQIEAARALGMAPGLMYRRIILPQAFRQVLPAYGNEMIQVVQASSLASTITLMELTGIARAIAARTYQPLEVFLVAGAFYLLLNLVIAQGVRLAERRFAKETRR